MVRASGRASLALGVWTMSASAVLTAQAPFAPLFDGKTLNGWVIENSDAANFTVARSTLAVRHAFI